MKYKSNFTHLEPEDGAIDRIMIHPRSMGSLSLGGQYSKENRHPRYTVEIHATNKDWVKHEEKLIGSEDSYVVQIQVENRNDSPAFAVLKI